MSTLSQPTLTELITEVRYDLNQSDSTNTFWTDAELTNYINRAIRRYFQELAFSMEGQFQATSTLDITANTDTISLPSDFFKVRALYKKKSDGSYSILHYRNVLTSGYSIRGGTTSDAYLPHYYFRDNSIVIHPTPNFSESQGLLLEYMQFPEVLVTGTDTMDLGVSAVFRDLIIAFAVWQAKKKESMVSGVDVTAIAKDHLNDQYQIFKEVIISRSANPTAVIPFNPEAE